MWWRGAAALYCVALVRGDALVEFNYDNTMMVGQDSTEFKGCAQVGAAIRPTRVSLEFVD